MSDQFISAITDEAMTRICYNGGWDLKPFKFLISESDVFSGGYGRDPWEYKDLWDNGTETTRENLKPQAFEYLKSVLTKEMQDDYTAGKVWYNARFSSISKTNEVTLCHHVNIPGDVAIDTTSKNIKTIYFVYQDNNGEDFCYGVARANGTLLFEHGISQSFFFNFTVSNEASKEMTEFVLNYSCAHEIEDHNTTFGADTHSDLVARDGSRNISGILNYTGITADDFTQGQQIVSKAYVDKYIQDIILPMINNEICPPGKLDYWPGPVNTIPSGWALRNGQLLTIADNPKLYAMFGQTYRNECISGTNYNTSIYFPLMNDSGLFIRGSEMNGNSIVNNNLLSGTGFAQRQNSAAPNIKGQLGGVNAWWTEGFYQSGGRITLSTRNGSNWGSVGYLNARRCSTVYEDGAKEARPNNRNYLPIIKLG